MTNCSMHCIFNDLALGMGSGLKFFGREFAWTEITRVASTSSARAISMMIWRALLLVTIHTTLFELESSLKRCFSAK